MNIPAVPESVTSQQVTDLLAALGIDANAVPRGASLRLGPDALSIDVYARDDAGKLYTAPDGQHPAMHHISIPIERETGA